MACYGAAPRRWLNHVASWALLKSRIAILISPDTFLAKGRCIFEVPAWCEGIYEAVLIAL